MSSDSRPGPWPLMQELGAIGERRAGTPQADRAREIIVRHLGLRLPRAPIREEPFVLEVVSEAFAEVACDGVRFPGFLFDNTGIGEGEVQGRPLRAGRHLSRRQARKVAGRVAVFTHNLLVHRVLQIHAARKNGAAAAVIESPHDMHIQRGVGYPPLLEPCSMPAVGITRLQGRRLSASRGAVTLRYQAALSPARLANVIVDLPGAGERMIVLGAHFDSWHAGCQDNAVGVQMLADLLERLASGSSLRHTVRAVFFDGEERGALGAYHHVSHNPPERYGFYLNLEMPVPTRNGRLKVIFRTADRTARRSFPRVTMLRRGILPVPLGLYYRLLPVFPADLDPFYRAGIPCATTFCSNPNIHTVLDTIDRIRMDQYPDVLNLLERAVRTIDRQLAERKGRP